MNRSYILGIDGGGTKTAAVVLSAEANEIARVIGGPSNFQSAGKSLAEATLRDVVQRVLKLAGITANDIRAIGLGMAGVYRPGDREIVEAMVSRIASFPKVVVTNDAEAALVGGVGRRHGVVLIAGTGALAFGINSHGETRRADGWGYIIGDEGSAHWIGAEALRAVARAHDGRGPTTALQTAILSHLGLAEPMVLVKRVYAVEFGVAQVANLARLVSVEANKGDDVARRILNDAAKHLAGSVLAVVSGLGMLTDEFQLVLTGGVVRPPGIVRDAVTGTVRLAASRAKAIDPANDAAFGAALLAVSEGE
jgi:N-acetylglucosamine kinase-like BadF-type ATPase